MKKHLLGLFAIVLATGFSAFTIISKNSHAKPDTDLYWYNFDGTRITSQVGSAAMTKSSAEDITGCSDNVNAAVCAYGYTNAQSGLPKLPGSSDDSFKKSQ